MPSTRNFSSSPAPEERLELDLSQLPPVFIVADDISTDNLHDLEDKLIRCGALLTYDASETNLFVGKVNTKKRAQFVLRRAHVNAKDVQSSSLKSPEQRVGVKRGHSEEKLEARKLRRLDSSATESGSETEGEIETKLSESFSALGSQKSEGDSTFSVKDLAAVPNVFVVKLAWLEESLSQRKVLAIQKYIVYEGERLARNDSLISPDFVPSHPPPALLEEKTDIASILARARADSPPPSTGPSTRFASAPHGQRRFRDQGHGGTADGKRPKLLDLETHSSQGDQPSTDHALPPPPAWVRQGLNYSCQRITPADPPNDPFIELLKRIRLARILTGDEIGVRAYSSSIAAIAAVPTKIVHPREITRLPGCSLTIANLWVEYRNTGSVAAANEVDEDDTLKALNVFYEIWGVGATTARDFWYKKGWRDIEDVVDYGWQELSRVQQIGVKFYDEFQLGIPRPEVEQIVAKVLDHGIEVRDSGVQAMAVGGYRRGKEKSGDVDIIVSHRELGQTAHLVTDILTSLEDEGWITHTLTVSLRATERGQSTLPFHNPGDKIPGAGFDTLDKALVVWQDINWPTKEEDLKKNPDAKNPNPHRRVDIIISPWRTVGCAVLGWSGGTTFQRDIRRYCKYDKEWKFDSSGVRSRRTGEVVNLEGENGVEGDMVDAEKTVFRGMGLEYREPWERCTG